METTSIFILFSAIVFIIILWCVIGVMHFSGLKKDIFLKWENLNEFLRKRLDIVPNLIETVRYNTGDYSKNLEDLIAARQDAVREDFNGPKKIEYEHDLIEMLNEVIGIAREVPQLAKDTNFLELRTEISYTNDEIAKKTAEFNDAVRKYNRHRVFPVLKPVSSIFGYTRADTFKAGV